MIPTQNTGNDTPSAANHLPMKSHTLPLYTADKTPRGMPMKMDTKNPDIANCTVDGIRSQMS